MNKLSLKMQKLIIWLTAYLDIVAFVLAGGYIYLKTEEEDAKSSAKTALIAYACFAAITALRSVIYNILSVADASYNTLAVLTDIGTVISILRVVVFAVFLVLDLYGIRLVTSKPANKEQPAEQSEVAPEEGQ